MTMPKRALILGTGLVSRPCIEKLLQSGFAITCVSAIQSELDSLLQAYSSLSTVLLEVPKNKPALKDLVRSSDVVLSLLPPSYHVAIALICIEEKRNLVTASYVDDHLEQLHDKASAAGITILTEAGLDPGIDHMIAMKCVDSLKVDGAEVTEFESVCGGIPAPDCAFGPLKYKFSWYPKGMFISALKPAKSCNDGKVVEYPIILDHPQLVNNYFEEYNLECIPNRDSLVYRDVYNIHSATTIFRGTLRYQGFSKALKVLIDIGLTKQSILAELTNEDQDLSWRELVATLLELPKDSSQDDIKQTFMAKVQKSEQDVEVLIQLGLLSDKKVPKKSTPLDALSEYLANALAYEPGEQDLVLMYTRVAGRFPSGQQRVYETSLIDRGTPVGGHSAMSKTVGLTAAFCAQLLAQGAVKQKGVILPTTKDIYEPILSTLSTEGIAIKTIIKDS